MLPIQSKPDFGILARNMIRSIATNAPAKNIYIRNFYRTANETGLQGNALISYFTELAKVQKLTKNDCGAFFGMDITNTKAITEVYDRTKRIDTEMFDFGEQNPTIKRELIKFMTALNKNYKNTIHTRSAILSQGTVVDGAVKGKTSGFKKFIIKMLASFKTD